MEVWQLIVAASVLVCFCVASVVFSIKDDKVMEESFESYKNFINNCFH